MRCSALTFVESSYVKRRADSGVAPADSRKARRRQWEARRSCRARSPRLRGPPRIRRASDCVGPAFLRIGDLALPSDRIRTSAFSSTNENLRPRRKCGAVVVAALRDAYGCGGALEDGWPEVARTRQVPAQRGHGLSPTITAAIRRRSWLLRAVPRRGVCGRRAWGPRFVPLGQQWARLAA